MIDALCDEIRRAFAGVTLGDGIGLREGQGLDDYADEETRARLRARDEKDDWAAIPVEELNQCHSSLSFFDAAGMRFHLPAFLIADLQGTFRFGMAFCLTHSSEYSRSQFALLSPPQRKAVRAVLLHMAEDANYEFERSEILRALTDYWTEPAA